MSTTDARSTPAIVTTAARRGLTIMPLDDALLSWRIVAVAWLFPAMADVAGMYVGERVSGAPTSFWLMAASVASVWGVWVPLTAAIFWLAHRAPIWRELPDAPGPGNGSRVRQCVLSWRGVSTHAAASLVAALVHAVVMTAVTMRSVSASTPAGPGGAWAARLAMTLEDWLPVSLLLYWMTLGAATALERVREAREQERRAAALEGRLARAELAVLRAQLEPHFLFNALNTAVSLVRSGEPEQGVDVLTRLADVLRHLLDGVAQETPLAEELLLLDGYLGIARARFGARLTVTLDIPSALDDAVVPGLALQPLVENALRHGVGRREGPGHVWVDAWVTRSYGEDPRAGEVDANGSRVLWLRVRDDGPGLVVHSAPGESTGVGLRNLRDRLERLYGASRAGLSLRDRDGGGAEATVWLPLRREVGEAGRSEAVADGALAARG